MIERMLSDKKAATRAGVSPPTFHRLVDQGIFPQPTTYPGIARKVWDVKLLDAALDKLSGIGGQLADEHADFRKRLKHACRA
jgi:hypothetical protein